MIAVAFLILGGRAFADLPLELLPQTHSPGLTVLVRWPNVAATRIERQVTIPAEQALADLAGIRDIRSESRAGEARINLVLDYSVDVDSRMLEAAEKIRRLRARLPPDVQPPVLLRYDPDDRPVFVVSFAPRIDSRRPAPGTSANAQRRLQETRQLVERNVKPLLERIDGISEVSVSGGHEREIQVLPLRGLLPANPRFLQQTLAANNRNVGAGQTNSGKLRQVVFKGRHNSVQSLANLPLAGASPTGGLRLRDVAIVRDHHRAPSSRAHTDGEPRVTVFVRKAGDAGSLEVTRQCREVLALVGQRERDLQFNVGYDRGLYIERALRGLALSALYGMIGAVLVLYVFLGRALLTLVTAASIPISIVATFLGMYLLDLPVNAMSLSGIALGSGLLIDNAVVITDRVHRLHDQGTPPVLASTGAVRATAAELSAATATTAIVFLPLLFTDPQTRLLYQDLAGTVVLSLVISLVYSVSILPGLLSVCLREADIKQERFSRGAERVLETCRGLIAKLERRLNHLAVVFVRRPRRTVLVGLVLLLSLPVAHSVCPTSDGSLSGERAISGRVDLPTDTDLSETTRRVNQVQQKLRSHPAIAALSTRIQKSQATLTARLAAGAPATEKLIEELNDSLNTNPGTFVYFQGSGAGSDPQMDLILLGEDHQALRNFARRVSGDIQHIEGVQQVLLRFRESGTDLILQPQRARLQSAQTSVREVGETLRLLLSGIVASKHYDGQRQVDVRLLGTSGKPPTGGQLLEQSIPVSDNQTSLANLVASHYEKSPRTLSRENRRPSAVLTVRYDHSSEHIAGKIERLMSSIDRPRNASFALGEQFRLARRGRRQLLAAVLAALLLIFMVLAGLFESLRRPAIILITAPTTIAVVIAVFAMLRVPLELNVYLGLILLAGMVVNNSILIISALRSPDGARAPGRAALLTAVRSRLRPILMTTLTTFVGLLPMLVNFEEGSQHFQVLALTVGLGLCVALPVSIGFVPALLFVVENSNQWRKK